MLQTHLVDQHYKNEFKPHLSPDFSIFPVSGKSEQRDFFGNVLQDSNVVICTAQILYNALTNMEEAKQVELSGQDRGGVRRAFRQQTFKSTAGASSLPDITLLIIDECHNTNKEGVYNKIMRRYVEKKLKGDEKLPQILGLTASPGSAGAKMLDKAVGHVLQVRPPPPPPPASSPWMFAILVDLSSFFSIPSSDLCQFGLSNRLT